MITHEDNLTCNRLKLDAYTELQRWDDALDQATKIVEKIPKSKMAYIDRGLTNYSMENYKDAIVDAQTAISLNHDRTLGSVGHRLTAMSYAAMGDLDNTLKFAHSIPELDPGQWFPPMEPVPAGTKAQFTAMVERMAHQVRNQQNS